MVRETGKRIGRPWFPEGDGRRAAGRVRGRGGPGHRVHEIHQAKEGGLIENRVRDLLLAAPGAAEGDAGAQAGLWIATATGINRVRGGEWTAFRDLKKLAGSDVRRLHWHGDKLWYVTAAGGLGHFDGSQWRELAGETHWKDHSDADLHLVALDPDREALWCVAKEGDMGRYDIATRRWEAFTAPGDGYQLLAVAVDPGAQTPSLLAGTSKGVLRLNAADGRWTTSGLEDSSVRSVDCGPGATVAVASPKTDQDPALVFAMQADSKWRRIVGPGRWRR